MSASNRRERLPKGRARTPLCVSLSPQTIRNLERIGKGNRSAAIEQLVVAHLERARVPAPEPEPVT